MTRSSWLTGTLALLRFTRSGRPSSAPTQKRERPPVIISVENGVAPSPLRLGTFDVGQEIRAILTNARPQRVRLEIAVQPDLRLHADSAAFRQALAGLVQHACSQALVSRVLVAASQSGESIQVGISDDCIGADLGSRQRALWPIERLIAQQGGSLEVASWPDQGTTVLTRWPEAGPAANRSGPVPYAVRERVATG